MSAAAKIKILLLSNILTVALLVFFMAKKNGQVEDQKQETENKPAAKHLYTDNGQYVEQTDFYTVFNTKANIVLLGNSHLYRMNWDELLGRRDVANRGIGSDITEGYLSRMESVLSVQPKICFLEGGGNDIGYDVPVDTIVQNFGKIIGILKAHQIKPVLTALFHAGKAYPHNDSNQYNNKVMALNNGLHELAAKDSIDIIDINDELNEDGFLRAEYVRNDGIHLTAKAYLIWKQEVEKILKKEGI